MTESANLTTGRLVARALSHSWRPVPSPVDLSPLDLDAIEPIVSSWQASALVWRQIAGNPELAESSAGAKLVKHARRLTLNAAVRERQLRFVWGAFRSARLDPVLIKGWAVARFYAAPELRFAWDIDLVVRPTERDDAIRVLEGFDLKEPEVDLHTGLRELDDRSHDELHERAHRIMLCGVEVLVPCDEDHLRFLCQHFVRHPGQRNPVWLCDIAAMLDYLPSDFDWDYFLTGWRWRTDWCIQLLHLAQDLLDARATEIPVAARRRRVPEWLREAILSGWGRPFQYWRPFARAFPNFDQLGEEIRTRWPNPIDATYAMRAPLWGIPRQPLQVMIFAGRIARRTGAILKNPRYQIRSMPVMARLTEPD